MHNFKPGDRIRIKRMGESDDQYPVGEPGTIIGYDRIYLKVNLDMPDPASRIQMRDWLMLPRELEVLNGIQPDLTRFLEVNDA